VAGAFRFVSTAARKRWLEVVERKSIALLVFGQLISYIA
jgi:hypothetical protein